MATITYKVTVATGTTQYGTGNRFYINGELAPVLYLQEGNTYIFDQSDSSNAVGGVHQIAFSTNPNNDPAAAYTTGVTSTGTPGSSGAQTTFNVAPVIKVFVLSGTSNLTILPIVLKLILVPPDNVLKSKTLSFLCLNTLVPPPKLLPFTISGSVAPDKPAAQ